MSEKVRFVKVLLNESLQQFVINVNNVKCTKKLLKKLFGFGNIIA